MQLGEALLNALRENGAGEVFGIPGDFALPLFKVIEESGILPLYTLSHEPGLGFAADGAARAGAGLGVVAVTYGAGALNLVNSIAAAFAERIPLVVLSGGPGKSERETGLMLHHQARTLRSQYKIFREITCDQIRLDDAGSAPGDIARVLGNCRRHSQPVYIEVPRDMAQEDCDPVPRLEDSDSNKAAASACAKEILDRITSAASPVIMVGVEVRRYHLESSIVIIAQKLGIEVVTSFMGQGLMDDTGFAVLGAYLGPSFDKALADRLDHADTLLMLGVIPSDMNFGASLHLLDPDRAIQVYGGSVSLGYHRYSQLSVTALVDAMLEQLQERKERQVPSRKKSHESLVDDAEPISSDDVVAAINDLLVDTGPMPVLADAGDCLFAACQIRGASLMAPGYYASMGFAVPAALGVQASTGKRSIVLVGDGGFQMTGWELGHCGRYGWDPIVIVLNNNGWGTLQSIQPQAGFCSLGDWRFAELANTLGGDGVRVRTRKELQVALLRAANTRGRFQLVEAVIPQNIQSGSRMLSMFLEDRITE